MRLILPLVCALFLAGCQPVAAVRHSVAIPSLDELRPTGYAIGNTDELEAEPLLVDQLKYRVVNPDNPALRFSTRAMTPCDASESFLPEDQDTLSRTQIMLARGREEFLKKNCAFRLLMLIDEVFRAREAIQNGAW